jgi:hypothetical protein
MRVTAAGVVHPPQPERRRFRPIRLAVAFARERRRDIGAGASFTGERG